MLAGVAWDRRSSASRWGGQRAARYRPAAGADLYRRWIDGLAVPCPDSAASPNRELDAALRRAKRPESGLASWAALSHPVESGAPPGEAHQQGLIRRLNETEAKAASLSPRPAPRSIMNA